MKHSFSLIICLINIQTTTDNYCSTIVRAGNSNPQDNYAFTSPVISKLFDQVSALFFVGLDTPTTSSVTSTGSFALSVAKQPDFFNAPQFTGIANDALLKNFGIEMLTTATTKLEITLLGIIIKNGTIPKTQTKLVITNTDGSNTLASLDIFDAGITTPATAAKTTTGIASIVGTPRHIVAAVKGADSGGVAKSFGENNSSSGFATIAIDDTSVNTVFALHTVDANTGVLDANQALPFSGDTNFTFITDIPSLTDLVPLYWDPILQRIFVGLSIRQTSANQLGVLSLSFDPPPGDDLSSKLVQINLLNTSAIDGNNIITHNDTTAVTSIQRLGIMRASTGTTYLIVNGGSTILTTDNDILNLSRNIYALPLVTDNSINRGLVADKNSAILDNIFVTPATAPGQLPLDTDIAAQVGAGPIDNTFIVTDMVVSQDTVYASIQGKIDANAGGILYSQAEFGFDGKIIRWTPWALYAAPVDAFNGLPLPDTGIAHNGSVSFFAVDTREALIWLIDGLTKRLVGVTTFQNKFTPYSLPGTLQNIMPNGCYCALDLPITTPGINNHGYTLFGADGKIIFSHTSTGIVPTIDFTNNQNFLVTQLPANSGPITSLSYTKQNSKKNFFLAGTPTGLYIKGNDTAGNGFDSAALSTLDTSPFTTGNWVKAPAAELQEPIVSIRCIGTNVYIITCNLALDAPSLYSLYSIPLSPISTVANTFNLPNMRLIAQTKLDAFDTTLVFYDCAPISTGPESLPLNSDQLLLATNQGIFYSDALQPGGVQNATDQITANWLQIPTHSTDIFNKIMMNNEPFPHTVWPISLYNNACNYLLSGNVDQISAQGDSIGAAPQIGTFLPENFNNATTEKVLNLLDPILYFWNDGARRFFIFNRENDPSDQTQIASLPFEPFLSGAPLSIFIDHPVLQKVKRLFFISTTGYQGWLIIGTDSGIIAFG